jgi:lipid-A-disaccharide synthase
MVTTPHKYYVIAGEASGDLHGGNLLKALYAADPGANVRCWGGDYMQSTGATLVKHYRDLAFMGFVEVVANLRTIFRNISFCKKDITQFKPDLLVLIDYPGFNLRIAKWAHKQGIKVVYYISPQVWAWKESRVKTIKRDIDKMLCILPFEQEFYSKWGYGVSYVGHPLVQVIINYKPSIPSLSIKPIVALLPGSRKQEIKAKLPLMLQVASEFPDYLFVVAKAPGLEDTFYQSMLAPYTNVVSVKGLTYDLLTQAKAALVTSGTATLETALFGVPQVVCYKGNSISYAIAKRLIKVKYISLVNLIMDQQVVHELIQDELTAVRLKQELYTLLNDVNRRRQLAEDYAQLKHVLSEKGNASNNAAQEIVTMLG